MQKVNKMRKLFFVVGAFAVLLFTQQDLAAQSAKDGLYYLEVEQYGNAAKTFKTLLSQTPNGENFYNLGNYYIQTDKLDSARVQFEQGIAKDPNYALNYVGLGSILMAKGDKAGAKTQFGKALSMKKAQKNAEIWYRIGEAYTIHKNNDPAEAVTALQKAVDIDKNKAEAYLMLGDAFLRKNDGTGAANNYEKAISINKALTKGYIKLGQLWIRAKNYQEALKKYNEGVQADPKYAPAYRQLGELYYMAKQYDKALESYQKYMSMSDNSPQAQFRYAGFLLLNKNYTEALDRMKQLESNPQLANDPILYRLLGYSYYETSDYQKGIENINKFFEKADTAIILPSDYAYLGKLLIASGQDTVKGLENITKAVQLDTAQAGLRRDVAELFYKGKSYLAAAQQYEAYILADTADANVNDYFDLGRSFYFGKDFVKADTVFSTVIDKMAEKDKHLGYLWKARAKASQDPAIEQGLAKPYYDRFIELVSADPEKTEKNKKDLVSAHLYIGSYNLKKAKDINKAHDAARKVLAIDPENKSAKQILQYKQSDLGLK